MKTIAMNFFYFYRAAIILQKTIASEDDVNLHNKFSFQPLNTTSGIFFEKVSVMKLFQDHWHIVYHIDLVALHAEFYNIKASVGELTQFCVRLYKELNFNESFSDRVKSHIYSRQCGAGFDKIKLMIEDIEEYDITWFHGTTHRRKRAPFNFIGTIFNSLFGTLSQKDAAEYLQQFKNLEESASETNFILDRHTTLIAATAQAVQELNGDSSIFQQKTTEQFDMLNNLTESLRLNYEDLWMNMELQFQLDNLITFISLSITSFQDKQRRFLEALSTNSQGNSYTPMILPPGTLLHELAKIQNTIATTSLDLPMPLNNDMISNFYRIATTRSRIINDQLIVQMSIPMVSTNAFDLFKVTSLPHRISGNAYSFIIPAADYIAIDNLREKFVPLTQLELSQCHSIEFDIKRTELICLQLSPIMSTNSEDCTVNMLVKQLQHNSCNTRLSNITSELWIRIQSVNSWIGVFPVPQLVYVKCLDFPSFQTRLLNTGIITIQEGCQVKTDNILITAQKSYTSDVYSRVQPNITHGFNATEALKLIDQIGSFPIVKWNYPNVLSLTESSKLKELSSGIQELKQFRDRKNIMLHSLPYNDQFDYWPFSFVVFLVIVTMALFFVGISHINGNTGSYTINRPEVSEPTGATMLALGTIESTI